MAIRRYIGKPKGRIPCGYCFSRWATGYDHLVPVSYGDGKVHAQSNLYPCCRRCNLLLSNLIFPTLEAKREYVRQRLIQKGKWKLPELQPGIHEDSPTSEVLLSKMPVVALEREASRVSSIKAGVEKAQKDVSRKSRLKTNTMPWNPFVEDRKRTNLIRIQQAPIQGWLTKRRAMWFDRPTEEELAIRIQVETGKIKAPAGYGIRSD